MVWFDLSLPADCHKGGDGKGHKLWWAMMVGIIMLVMMLHPSWHSRIIRRAAFWSLS